MIELEDVYRLTDQTLSRLRQMRTAALAKKEDSLDPDIQRDAEQLIEGIVAFHIAYLEGGQEDKDVMALWNIQQELLSSGDTQYQHERETSALRGNNGLTISGKIERYWQDQTPYRLLFLANKISPPSPPGRDDLIVTPLSTGPIILRFLSEIGIVNGKIAIAAAEGYKRTKAWFPLEEIKQMKVYLPLHTSWPEKERIAPDSFVNVWILDDARSNGVTNTALSLACEKIWHIRTERMVR